MAKDYAKKFYASKAWHNCRTAYLAEKKYCCERCNDTATIVHHRKYITPSNITNPEITLNFDNLEALCESCHNKEHFGEEKIKPRFAFDCNGRIIPPP